MNDLNRSFGDLVRYHLNRKRGLSQNKLAYGIDVDPAILTRMCHGVVKNYDRGKVLSIIHWFYENEVLNSIEEADALLYSANLANLDTNRSSDTELLHVLVRKARHQTQEQRKREEQPQTHGQRIEAPPLPVSRIGQKIQTSIIVGAIVVLAVLLITAYLWMQPKHTPVAWQEDFNPLDGAKWTEVTARWEDIPGLAALLIEDNSETDFGKIESQP